ncbi:AraC family transcriptional regulator [Ensifer soli]|uniref:AraC family transcriptional regulator n=1 Tax=Ciceribacter sp. sgz301302 TaxID=3342379 RepID=UPI0035BB1529
MLEMLAQTPFAAPEEPSPDWIDTVRLRVLGLGRDYEAGVHVDAHSHRRTQLWTARRGVVLVRTPRGRWMIPPGHGLVIPAGLDHSAEMVSAVTMHSIYFDTALPSAAMRPRVVEVTPLARCLIDELVAGEAGLLASADVPPRAWMVMELLLDEVARLPERPLGLPFPQDERLSALCRRFLKVPSATAGIDDWADALKVSRRSFTRLFRTETGVSFVTWRQQACIFASLPRLADGEPVTTVALEAGYENVAAFTTMFRRMLGRAPSAWARQREV